MLLEYAGAIQLHSSNADSMLTSDKPLGTASGPKAGTWQHLICDSPAASGRMILCLIRSSLY
jgi:hypothetical protein